jgi:hypothetical protein
MALGGRGVFRLAERNRNENGGLRPPFVIPRSRFAAAGGVGSWNDPPT